MSSQTECVARKTMKADQMLMPQLPNPFLGQESSLLFIKKMTAIAVSNIVYGRNMFAEKDFGVRDVGGISVKILRGGEKRCPGSGCLVKWLDGVYDAIDKQYLRNLYLEIISNTNGKIREQYEIKFVYAANEITCSLKKGGTSFSITASEMEDTRQAVKNLIRNIFAVTTTQDPLRGELSLCMKLRYMDGTPLDYEPKGFQPSDMTALTEFESKPYRWTLGGVTTPYHNFMVKCTLLTDTRKNIPCANNSTPSEVVTGSSSEDIIPPSEEPLKGPLKGKGELLKVKCPCDQDDKKGIMLHCQDCGMFQHAACYGVLKNEDVPQNHTCLDCHSEGKPCSDVTLFTKSKEGRKDTCFYRRVLLVCTNNTRLSLAKLSQEMDISETLAITVMRRLQRDRAFKQSLQAPSKERPNFSFSIDESHLQNVLIPRHFNMTSNTKDEPLKSFVAPRNKRKHPSDSTKSSVKEKNAKKV